jgi:uncharacterized lipoprotein YbaY
MKTTIALSLALLAIAAGVGCTLNVENPYQVPPPGPGPQPPPLPPPGPKPPGGWQAPHLGEHAIPQGPLAGTIRWSGMHIVPPAAVLRIELWDAARLRRIRGRIAQRELTHFGHSPVAFKLPFDRGDLEADRDYVVIARIVVDNKVVRRTGEPVPVITKGRPMEVDLQLERVEAQ